MRADVLPHRLELARLIARQQVPLASYTRRRRRSLRSLCLAQCLLTVHRWRDAQHLARAVAKLRMSAVAGTCIDPAPIVQAGFESGSHPAMTQEVENVHQYPVLALPDPEALIQIIERRARSTGKGSLDGHVPPEPVVILDRRQEGDHRLRRCDVEERVSCGAPHRGESAVFPQPREDLDAWLVALPPEQIDERPEMVHLIARTLDCLEPGRVHLRRSRVQQLDIFPVRVRDPPREVRREQDRGMELLKRPACSFAHARLCPYV